MRSSNVATDFQGRPQRIDVVDLPGVRLPVDKGADVSWRGWGQAFEQFWAWAYNASAGGRPNVSEAVGTDELSHGFERICNQQPEHFGCEFYDAESGSILNDGPFGIGCIKRQLEQ
eukprot:12401678-Karenia_brevis.AAC.1